MTLWRWEVEKDDISDIKKDRQKSSVKKKLVSFKTCSCLLTSILLLIIIIICTYYFSVPTSPPSNTLPPSNLTDQGDRS